MAKGEINYAVRQEIKRCAQTITRRFLEKAWKEEKIIRDMRMDIPITKENEKLAYSVFEDALYKGAFLALHNYIYSSKDRRENATPEELQNAWLNMQVGGVFIPID